MAILFDDKKRATEKATEASTQKDENLEDYNLPHHCDPNDSGNCACWPVDDEQCAPYDECDPDYNDCGPDETEDDSIKNTENLKRNERLSGLKYFLEKFNVSVEEIECLTNRQRQEVVPEETEKTDNETADNVIKLSN